MAGLGLLAWNTGAPPAFNPSLRRPFPQRDELLMYCAAGLLTSAQAICADYEKEYGVAVRIEADSSGRLLSKIRITPDQGDLFLADAESYVREARSLDLVAEILPVARQHLVLGVQPGNPLKIAGFKDLLDEKVRVVLPNAELTAAGKSAQRTLAGTTEWDALIEQTRKPSSHVSLTGTVTEAAQAVKIGAADAAILWDATARQFEIGEVEVPVLQSKATEQVTLGVLKASDDPAAALRFARYLTARDRGELVLQKHHLQSLDDADVWDDNPSLVFMCGAMLKPGVDGLVNAFAQREGVTINTIYADCGPDVAQRKATKKESTAASHFPDACFASDVSLLKQVQQWFEAPVVVSRNDMVIVVAKGNPKQIRSIQDFARPDLKIGLTQPVNLAFLALTEDLLKKCGLHDKAAVSARRRPVVHADAGQVLIKQMRSGELDAAIVYRSNLLGNWKNLEKYLDVVELNLPEAVAIQACAVAKDSAQRHLMGRLLEAILSPSTKERFCALGFQWIAEDPPK